jgi:hypothetical protein
MLVLFQANTDQATKSVQKLVKCTKNLGKGDMKLNWKQWILSPTPTR